MIVVLLLACGPDRAWIDDRAYPSIPAAVQASEPGDTVHLARGRHLVQLHLPHPLTLIGDGTVLDAEERGPNLVARADVELDGVTLQGGMGPTPVVDVQGTLVARDVLIDRARGLTTLHAARGLDAHRLFIDSPHATTAIRADGGSVWLDDSVIDVPMGGSLVAGRADSVRLSNTELTDFWGALVRAETIELTGVGGDTSVVLEADHIAVSGFEGRRLSMTGTGIARGVAVDSLGSTGVDIESAEAVEVLSLRTAVARRVRMGGGTREPIISLSESEVEGLLVRDEAAVYGPTHMFFLFGRNRVSHLTWLGGRRTLVHTEGELILDQSIIAGTHLMDTGSRFTEAPDTFGWGHGLPWTTALLLPWVEVEPQLDGDDLAADSALWGVGPDGHPGAFGGPWGLTAR